MTAGFLRLFLGLPLTTFSDEIKQTLSVLGSRLDGIRWILPQQCHVTIHFFGDTPVSEVKTIDEALRPLFNEISPLEIRLTEIGAFPDMKRPNVLWVGAEEPRGTLREFVLRVRQVVKRLGYPVENRPFKPHATLGRIKNVSRQGEIESMIKGLPLPFPTALKPLKQMVLFKSELQSSRAVYEALKEYPIVSTA